MAAKELRSAADLPALSTAPSTVYQAAVVVAGATQGAAQIYAAPIDKAGETTVYNLAAGNTVLTLAMTLYDLIVSDNAGVTSLEIPSEATLGYTRVVGKELSICVQRRGLGVFSVNFTGGGPAVVTNDVDPVNLGIAHGPVYIGTIGAANTWAMG